MGQIPKDAERKFGTRAFEAGEVIFVEGDFASEAYIIESGRVDICKLARNDRGGVVLGSLEEGAIFGEMALVDNTPRMASAVCVEDCVLWVVPVDIFNIKLKNADPFLRAIIQVLARNARSNALAYEAERP